MEKLLSIEIKLRKPANSTECKPAKVRLFSQWFACSFTTPTFGDEELLAWKDDGEDYKAATHTANVAYDLSSPDKLKLFNEKPGIYAVILDDATPLGFSYVDCSSFVLEPGTCFARHAVIGGYEVDISATTTAAFLTLTDSVKLEPVVLDIKR
jgi:hypothetical protein